MLFFKVISLRAISLHLKLSRFKYFCKEVNAFWVFQERLVYLDSISVNDWVIPLYKVHSVSLSCNWSLFMERTNPSS